VPNFVEIAQTTEEICQFSISQDSGHRHLGFWQLRIFNGRAVRRVELHHRTKFRENRLNRGRDMAFFVFFKMAVAAILDF